MRHKIVFTALLLLFVLIGTASAVNNNYTENFTATDIVRINQSIAQDPTLGHSIPWDLWIYAGFIALALTVIALLKPRLYQMDYELSIILSLLAWPFSWYFTWGAITSIDMIIGVTMTSTGGATMVVTQHILYTFPIIAWMGVSSDVAMILITALYIAQYRMFKEKEEKEREKQRSESQ